MAAKKRAKARSTSKKTASAKKPRAKRTLKDGDIKTVRTDPWGLDPRTGIPVNPIVIAQKKPVGEVQAQLGDDWRSDDW